MATDAPSGTTGPTAGRGVFASIFCRPGRLLAVLVLLASIGVGAARGGLFLLAGWHERKGQQLAACYDFDTAGDHYEKSLRLWSGRSKVHFVAARAARRARNFDLAEKHLSAVQDLLGTSADAQLERLLLNAQNGGLDDVEDALKQYLEKDVETLLVLEALADGYLRENRLADADEVLTRLLGRDPNHVSGLYHKGRFLRKVRRLNEAKETFERILQLQPNHFGAHEELSEHLLDDDTAAAREHVHFLLKRRPDSDELQFRDYLCLKKMGQAEVAAEKIDEMLAEHPDNPYLLIERGVLALERSDAVGAEAWLRKVLKLDPYHQEANFRLAQALLQQPSRLEEARKQLALCNRIKDDVRRIAEIQRTEPSKLAQSPAELHECGVILLRYGKDAEAVEWLQRALQVDLARKETHQILADHFERIVEKERAAGHRRLAKSESK